MAGGLTKLQSRNDFAYVLRRGYHALKFDANFRAGKKLTKKERDKLDAPLEGARREREFARKVSDGADERSAQASARGARRARTRDVFVSLPFRARVDSHAAIVSFARSLSVLLRAPRTSVVHACAFTLVCARPFRIVGPP